MKREYSVGANNEFRTIQCKRDVLIRVAQVIYALKIGGSEMLASRVARALNQGRRYACSIYGLQGSGTLAEKLAAEGIPARAFSKNGRFDVKLIVRLAKQFRADGVQMLHTHHLGQLLYGGIAGKLAGAKVIHTEHEYYSLTQLRHRRLLRLLSVMAQTVTSVAEPVTEFLRCQVGIPCRKLVTITNGVDVALFQTAPPISRATLGWRDKDIVIGCLARLETEKGHSILLEALKKTRVRYPYVNLALIGDGSERGRLEQMVRQLGLEHAVQFLGNRTDVPELLASCDIVALASLQEGLPLSLLEAMAAGKPVVATRVGSVPQVVLEGQTGLLVGPGDSGALGKAIEILVGDQANRARLGTHGLDLVKAYYSFERMMAQYIQLYDAALSRCAE